jgi:hypothetical protein
MNARNVNPKKNKRELSCCELEGQCANGKKPLKSEESVGTTILCSCQRKKNKEEGWLRVAILGELAQASGGVLKSHLPKTMHVGAHKISYLNYIPACRMSAQDPHLDHFLEPSTRGKLSELGKGRL